MRPAVISFLCYLFIISSFHLRSQEPFSFYIHHSVNDGLPSSKVFDMIQDSKGYMWFATENGVSRYNGYGFRNFTTEDGLPTNSTLRIYEDRKGRIWFTSYEGPISYYQDGQIHLFSLNDELLALNVSFVSNIYLDEHDAIWLTSFTGGLIKVDSNLRISAWMPFEDLRVDGVYFFVDRRADGKVIAFFNSLPDMNSPEPSQPGLFEHGKFYKMNRTQSDNHINYIENDGRTYLTFGRKIYLEDHDSLELIREFSDEIVAISKDNRGNVWVSEKFHGVYLFAGGDLRSNPLENFFKGQSISNVVCDREGNYWFATTAGGVYFVPSIDLHIYNSDNFDIASNVVLEVEIREDDIFFSTDHKGLYHGTISGDQVMDVQSIAFTEEFTNNINSILSIPGDLLYVSGDFLPLQSNYIYKYKKGRYTIYPVEYGYRISRLINGDIVLGHFNGIKLIQGDRIHYVTPSTNADFRVFDAIQGPDSSLLLGSVKGLIQFKDSVYSPLNPGDPVMGSRISSLALHNGFLWVGSFEEGLAINTPDTVIYINENNGLSSNHIKTIYPDNDTTVWIGTNKGLNKITVGGEFPMHFTAQTMDIWNGLPSNEVNQVKRQGSYLWLATDKGLVSFDPDIVNLDPNPSCPIYFDRVVVDPDMPLPLDRPSELRHNENSIEFEFHAVTYHNPLSTIYNYKLDELSPRWNATHNTSVRFHGLDPGHYTFQVFATGSSGAKSETLSYHFHIRKHFTQTWWFITILVIVVLLVAWFIGRNALLTHRRRLQLQRQIYLAEQKAMLSQMNPHFIFNSLNSIQNFILENDHANANVYLVMFSSLIRKILDASQKNFISLKDELDIIKLYLELEKFRFRDRFGFSIHVDPKVNPGGVSIPSMILQPYLENAIWHGIMPKEGKGTVEVEVRSKQGMLHISIKDDGIGRMKAGTISKRRKHHKPTGMRNVEQRLKLLNELNNTHMAVKVVDLLDENGAGCGTRVELIIDE